VIDLRRLREDPDVVRASQRARGADEALVDAVLAADERRRAVLTEFERARADQKALGRRVAGVSGDERHGLLVKARELADEVKALQGEVDAADDELDRLARRIDNVVQDATPPGGEDDYVAPKGSGPWTTWRWASGCVRSTPNVARRSPGRASTS